MSYIRAEPQLATTAPAVCRGPIEKCPPGTCARCEPQAWPSAHCDGGCDLCEPSDLYPCLECGNRCCTEGEPYCSDRCENATA